LAANSGDPNLRSVAQRALAGVPERPGSRWKRKKPFERLHIATNGLPFAQDPDFAGKARAAGLRSVSLQFGGVSNEKNSHRGSGNLFDVELQAFDNIARAGYPYHAAKRDYAGC
jgi:hypothetical protein